MSDHQVALVVGWIIAASVCQLGLSVLLLVHAVRWVRQEWRAMGRPVFREGNGAAAGEGTPAAALHQRSE